MDSAQDYIPDPARQPVYWHHRPAIRYPYSVPASTLVPVGGAYMPYSSQQIGSVANQASPVSQIFPLIAGVPGHISLSSVPTESLDNLRQALDKMHERPQMTDPLSLMASLVDVATAGVQASRTLYSFATVIGGAGEEIMSIGKEISAFSGILRDLHDLLDDAKDLISKRALVNANQLLKSCKEVFARIHQMVDSCNTGPRMDFWQNLQLSFRREQVKPICAKLESFKLTLAILLSTMRLARCRQKIGGSKSMNASSKERRYRANLETDILNNSAAITRWGHIEIEAQGARGGDPYSDQHYVSVAPSKELQWLSSLVPYKPSQPQTPSSDFPALSPIPETPDNLNEQAQVQITKVIDVLLAKWTTSYAIERPKKPELGRRASPNSDTRSKSKPRRQAVAESGDRVRNESEKESSDMSRRISTSLAASAPEDLVHPADSDKLQNNVDTETIGLPSTPLKPAPLSTTDFENTYVVERDPDELTEHPEMNITVPRISNHWGDEASKNNDEGNLGDLDEATSTLEFTDSLSIETDDTESEPSEAYSSNTVTPSESRSGRPRRSPVPPSALSSDSYDEYARYATIPPDHVPPYGAWPYGPYGPPPNLASPYGPAQFAPLSYNHIAYCVPQYTGHAQTIYNSQPVSYMSPPPLGIVPGPYPGFISLPNPQSAPLAQTYNDTYHIDLESSDNRTVRFKDAIGREFTFPFRKCKRWADMETLIEQALVHIDDKKLIGQVKSGHFDLMDPSGAIILPSLWETSIRPDWTVTMHMWPFPKDVEEPTKVPPPPKPPPLPSSAVPPPVPMAPSVIFETRSRTVPREGVALKHMSRASRRGTDSVNESISNGDDSDESNLKSTYQDMFTESFTKHGQQFEETWEAVMARSRVEAQKTILEMWLSKSEAELRKLAPSPSGEQRTNELGPKPTSTSENIWEDENNSKSMPGRGNRASNEVSRLGHRHYTGQAQPPSPTASHIKGLYLCQSCKSPLFSSNAQQAPAVNEIGSFQSSGGEEEHIAPEHVLPRSSLEHRIETPEGLIKRPVADLQERLDKAKDVGNEQHLGRLEKGIIQTSVQTPPSIPPMSEPLPVSRRDSPPRWPLHDRSGHATLSNDSRSSFRKRLFGRSVSSLATVG